MTNEFKGTHFEQVCGRLLKELSAQELNALHKRDANPKDDEVRCAYCLAEIPLFGQSTYNLAVCYHHRVPRGMGSSDTNRLADLIPVCAPHHQEPYQSMRDLGACVMSATGKAKPQDYPEMNWELYPPLKECFGHYEYGTQYYAMRSGIPETIQHIFVGQVSLTLNDYCLVVCPASIACHRETRAKILLDAKRNHDTTRLLEEMR